MQGATQKYYRLLTLKPKPTALGTLGCHTTYHLFKRMGCHLNKELSNVPLCAPSPLHPLLCIPHTLQAGAQTSPWAPELCQKCKHDFNSANKTRKRALCCHTCCSLHAATEGDITSFQVRLVELWEGRTLLCPPRNHPCFPVSTACMEATQPCIHSLKQHVWLRLKPGLLHASIPARSTLDINTPALESASPPTQLEDRIRAAQFHFPSRTLRTAEPISPSRSWSGLSPSRTQGGVGDRTHFIAHKLSTEHVEKWSTEHCVQSPGPRSARTDVRPVRRAVMCPHQ